VLGGKTIPSPDSPFCFRTLIRQERIKVRESALIESFKGPSFKHCRPGKVPVAAGADSLSNSGEQDADFKDAWS